MSAMIARVSEQQTCARRFRNARICSFSRHYRGTRALTRNDDVGCDEKAGRCFVPAQPRV